MIQSGMTIDSTGILSADKLRLLQAANVLRVPVASTPAPTAISPRVSGASVITAPIDNRFDGAGGPIGGVLQGLFPRPKTPIATPPETTRTGITPLPLKKKVPVDTPKTPAKPPAASTGTAHPTIDPTLAALLNGGTTDVQNPLAGALDQGPAVIVPDATTAAASSPPYLLIAFVVAAIVGVLWYMHRHAPGAPPPGSREVPTIRPPQAVR